MALYTSTPAATAGRELVASVERGAIALAEIPASTSEEARLAWLEKRLRGAAGERSRDEAGNLVWRCGEPPFRLALLAHVDTVSAADVAHAVVEENGWLCGPGIGDNALAVSVAACVVEAAAADLRTPFAVVFTVGEEGLGGLVGARHACAALESVISLEGAASTQSAWTRSAASAWPSRSPAGAAIRGGTGAVRARHMRSCRYWKSSWRAVPTASRSTSVASAGGEAVNAIARHTGGVVLARSPDEASLEAAYQVFRRITVGDGLELTVETLDRRPAGRLDRRHPLLVAVREERAKLDLPDRFLDGSTDANAALALGIPELTLGCARGADMHAPSERIERSWIADGVAQLDLVLRRLLT
ncbi:MAG: M20/M25/M40 family metallo-hydrolase [Gaiellaceae bacterium]